MYVPSCMYIHAYTHVYGMYAYLYVSVYVYAHKYLCMNVLCVSVHTRVCHCGLFISCRICMWTRIPLPYTTWLGH